MCNLVNFEDAKAVVILYSSSGEEKYFPEVETGFFRHLRKYLNYIADRC
jgi:hypothetical protein